MRRASIALLCLLLAGCSSGPLVVSQIHSGVDFELRNGDRYRLAGLVPPPLDHELAETCRLRLAKLLLDREVELKLEPTGDGPRRAFVYTPIDVDGVRRFLFVNAEMALFGWALPDERPAETEYGEHYDSVAAMVERSRAAQQGLWSQEP